MPRVEPSINKYWDSVMMKGILKIRVLMSVEKSNRYPYALLKCFKKSKHPIESGANKSEVYNILSSLEKQGFVRSKQVIVRSRLQRVYSITDKGKRSLKTFKSKFSGFMTEIRSLIKSEFNE